MTTIPETYLVVCREKSGRASETNRRFIVETMIGTCLSDVIIGIQQGQYMDLDEVWRIKGPDAQNVTEEVCHTIMRDRLLMQNAACLEFLDWSGHDVDAWKEAAE